MGLDLQDSVHKYLWALAFSLMRSLTCDSSVVSVIC